MRRLVHLSLIGPIVSNVHAAFPAGPGLNRLARRLGLLVSLSLGLTLFQSSTADAACTFVPSAGDDTFVCDSGTSGRRAHRSRRQQHAAVSWRRHGNAERQCGFRRRRRPHRDAVRHDHRNRRPGRRRRHLRHQRRHGHRQCPARRRHRRFPHDRRRRSSRSTRATISTPSSCPADASSISSTTATARS